jgi:hypothetical protein
MTMKQTSALAFTALLLAPLAGLLAAGWPLQRRGGVSSTQPFLERCRNITPF